MKNTMKKVLCTLVVAILCLTSIPLNSLMKLDWFNISAQAADMYNYGDYTYSIGQMVDTDLDSVSIYSYDGTESSITIPSEINGYVVTHISASAFRYNEYLNEVIIPESVEFIDSQAFYGCSNLSRIDLGSNIKYIGGYAFHNTAFMKDKSNWTNGFLYLDNYLIAADPLIIKGSINVSDDVKVIAGAAFDNCVYLTDIVLPSEIEFISSDTFNCCVSLESITIPDTVSYILSAAFNNCLSLKSVELPLSIKEIGYYAFNACFSLKDIVIPNKHVDLWDHSIGYSHYSVSDLSTFTSLLKQRIIAELKGEDVTALDEAIQTVATPHENNGNSIIIGNVFEKMEVPTIHGFANSTAENYANDNGLSFIANQSSNNSDFLYNYLDNSKIEITKYCGTSTDVKIPSYILGCEVFGIAKGAFQSTEITAVTMPNSLNYIDDEAFYGCFNLKTVVLNEGLKTIGYNAFAFTSVEKITIPSTVVSADNGAFGNCPFLKSAEIKSDALSKGGTFMSSYSLTDVILSDKVTNIGDATFYMCTSLTNINLTENIESIGDYAFVGCLNLKNTTIKNLYTDIGTLALGYTILISDKTAKETAELYDRYTLLAVEYFKALFDNDENKQVSLEIEMTEISDLISAGGKETLIDGFTLYGHTDSTAETYAAENGINFVDLDAECAHTGGTATCEEKAICEICGEEYGELADHIPTTYRQEASCEVNGYVITSCEVCLEELDFEILPAPGHTPGEPTIKNETAATCEEDGSYDKVVYCTVCPQELSRETIIVDATGHNWDNGVVTTVAKCNVKEVKLYTCKNNAKHTKETIGAVNPNNHIGTTYLVGKTDADCVNDGYTGDTHCSGCQVKLSSGSVIKAPGHKGGTATCQKKAVCNICGTEYGKLDAHSPVTETIAATCTNSGYERTVCSLCSSELSYKTIDSLGHKFGEWNIDRNATLLEEGLKSRVCARCPEKETETIPCIKGEESKDEKSGISIEYTDDSYDGKNIDVQVEEEFKGSQYVGMSKYGKTASWNIKTYIDGEEIQPDSPVLVKIPLPEDFDPAKVTIYHVNSITGKLEKITPVYIEDGYIKFLANSFSVYIVVDESSKHEHSHTSSVTKAPTCTEQGTKIFTCSCGDSYTETIPSTGHSHNKVVTAPTCTAKGYTTYSCSCGDSYVADYVNAKGHKDDNKDYKCDNGCGHEFQKPAEPEVPSAPSENCSCNCHKGGFMGFIWKIINFFQKLFKINPVCACGAAHY